MFPSSPRSASHSAIMAQQSGYYGTYYPSQQTSNPYQPSDFNSNFQPLMTPSQMGEGFQSGWYNHPMYMSPSHGPHTPAMYQQRSSGYDEYSFMSSLHHSSSSGAPSPGLLHPLPPSSTSSSLSGIQPPHTPSPCAIPNGTSVGQGSPYYTSSFCKVPPEFGENEGNHSNPEETEILSEVSLEPNKSPTQIVRPQQARSPYEWMKKSYHNQNGNTDEAFVDIDNMTIKGSIKEEDDEREPTWKSGKTRTKDKYRVVYTDHQRLELEKEFHYSRYITIRRKSELAAMLGLSERQVKIWFQNRRAKERKQLKKRDEIVQKEKIETGMQFHQGPPHHQMTHHHPPPPMLAHTHLSAHPGLAPHSKPPSLMMDVKPTLNMD